MLLISNVKAKVTDFGMARLKDFNPHLTFTMVPGTDVYMPPEAVKNKPVYTEKVDCFSFGVICIQILTRLFPEPGDRLKEVNDPHFSDGKVEIYAKVSEIERRHNHISKVDPSQPLLLIALDCLKDEDINRPSSQQLCERMTGLKGIPAYSESARATKETNLEKDRELNLLREQVQGLQQQLGGIRQQETQELRQQLEH